jgi:hypothetical protein
VSAPGLEAAGPLGTTPAQTLPESTKDIRAHVRAVLTDLRARGVFTPGVDSWIRGVDPEFSAILGAQGWIGLTWPVEYGGQGRSYLDRFVVLEELLIGPRRRPPRRPAWPTRSTAPWASHVSTRCTS